MRSVYFDVENTLNASFVTGIQRVTREFSKLVVDNNRLPLKHYYTPVLYDHNNLRWRKLDKQELELLLSFRVTSLNLLSRIKRKITNLFTKPEHLYIKSFEKNSIFLDIESSWHSKLKRRQLLPDLNQAGVKIAKLHYDIIPLLFPETTHPDTISSFTDHLVSHLKISDLFLCISQTSLNDVSAYCEKLAITPPNLKTVQLGTDLHFSQRLIGQEENSFDTKIYGRYLLSVGTLEPRKNHRLLIQSFDQLKEKTNLNIVIVGKIGWLTDDFFSELKAHPDYGTRIHYLGNITDLQLNSLYLDAWLSVVPSLYEGFGLTVVESLIRGCPTICSNAGSLSEAGGHNVQYFSPFSSNELANLILQLSADVVAYEKLKNRAKKFKPVSWHKTVESIDRSLYDLST